MVAKKDDLMWKPCGPPFCSLFCTLELDYSQFFDPQIFIKVSALQPMWAIAPGAVGGKGLVWEGAFAPGEWTECLERHA